VFALESFSLPDSPDSLKSLIFSATNYKLTWDYGTNMQPNDNKGSITFSEVFLDGKYIGHQFTGTLIRQENAKEVTKTFVGFTRVADLAIYFKVNASNCIVFNLNIFTYNQF
jgi:hypothetical protein